MKLSFFKDVQDYIDTGYDNINREDEKKENMKITLIMTCSQVPHWNICRKKDVLCEFPEKVYDTLCMEHT